MKGFTRHLIFYRPITNRVEIIRVIHTQAISRGCSSCKASSADEVSPSSSVKNSLRVEIPCARFGKV
jgi:hypothetical protein